MKKLVFTLALLTISCSLWEYEDPSNPIPNAAPETYLSLIARDTIYASIDDIVTTIDPITGEEITDTIWVYAISEEPNPGMVWDTLEYAFTTITTSRQILHWWGEDPDGDVIGYRYRWNVDSTWTFTTKESGLFYVPIRRDLDVFQFSVEAVDNDSTYDPTPARLTLPIRNSPPMISFRYRSNPSVTNIQSDTSFTFPTRTFVWDIFDQDGNETITDIFYALDDTCDTCWNQLDAASYSSITLTNLQPGFHTFYLKVRDIAGAVSPTIQFPDTANIDEPNFWKVVPVTGDVLLVDDFFNDSNNLTQAYFRSILDTIIGPENYSVWEIGEELPYSSADVSANLNYFQDVIWFAGTTGESEYIKAGSNIYNFILGGGNIFITLSLFQDTSFVWFPIDSLFSINPDGRLLPPVTLVSQVRPELNLVTSRNVGYHWIKGFENFEGEPAFRSLYRLQEPNATQKWEGTPTVCGVYQFFTPNPSGKAVLMSIPWHEGVGTTSDLTYGAFLEGNGSAGKFIRYLLEEEF